MNPWHEVSIEGIFSSTNRPGWNHQIFIYTHTVGPICSDLWHQLDNTILCVCVFCVLSIKPSLTSFTCRPPFVSHWTRTAIIPLTISQLSSQTCTHKPISSNRCVRPSARQTRKLWQWLPPAERAVNICHVDQTQCRYFSVSIIEKKYMPIKPHA